MNVKKIAVTILKYMFLILFLCLLVAILWAAERMRQ